MAEFHEHLLIRIETLPFPPRALRCLRAADIEYTGELVQRGEDDLLCLPNFGRGSLGQVKGVLAELGLELGMLVPDWSRPPPGEEAAVAPPPRLTRRNASLEIADQLRRIIDYPWALNPCEPPHLTVLQSGRVAVKRVDDAGHTKFTTPWVPIV